MDAVSRVAMIRSNVDQLTSFVGGRRSSFEDALENAGPGGPVIELPDVPAPEPVAGFVAAQVEPSEPTFAAQPVEPSEPTFAAQPVEPGSEGADPIGPPAWSELLPAGGRGWLDEILAAADRHRLDRSLFTALVWSESAFRADAVSPAGARGLAQLMPGTAAGLGVNPDDPVQNLEGGARYLAEQLDRFGDTELALAAYNAGPGRVLDAGGIPNIAETRAYVRIVTERATTLEEAS